NEELMVCEILFIFNSAVERHKKLKARLFRQPYQFTILLSRKSQFRNGCTIVPRKMVLEPSRHALVKQHSHRNWLSTRALACSRASIAVWRVTVGKSSRNSSIVWPASR